MTSPGGTLTQSGLPLAFRARAIWLDSVATWQVRKGSLQRHCSGGAQLPRKSELEGRTDRLPKTLQPRMCRCQVSPSIQGGCLRVPPGPDPQPEPASASVLRRAGAGADAVQRASHLISWQMHGRQNPGRNHGLRPAIQSEAVLPRQCPTGPDHGFRRSPRSCISPGTLLLTAVTHTTQHEPWAPSASVTGIECIFNPRGTRSYCTFNKALPGARSSASGPQPDKPGERPRAQSPHIVPEPQGPSCPGTNVPPGVSLQDSPGVAA